MSVRIGRITYKNGKKQFPSYPGFETIEVMTASTKYGSLSPYQLKNSKGQSLENIWQFSKVYSVVPKSTQRFSRYNQTVIWSHPKELHCFKEIQEDSTQYLDSLYLTEEYWNWREKGFNNHYAVRYPVGYKSRGKCLFAIKEDDIQHLLEYDVEMDGEECIVTNIPSTYRLDYISSRKEIYVPLYIELVRKQRQYRELRRKLENGKNLLIAEVDGPHQESLDYYKNKYGVNDDFIVERTTLVTKTGMELFLEDTKHPFGHGYCLGMALLGITLT
jgi:hypothetical protein